MQSLPLNPYIAGNPISDPQRFFGREDVFSEVMKVLRHPQENAIVLYGQRRIGKTSVLLQLEKQLDARGEFTSVYFDLQDKAAKPLAEVLYELSQCISVKTTKTTPNRKDFDKTGDYFRKTFLTTAANAAAPSGLVLLFDEFDVLDNPQQSQAGQAFFPYLRTWMAYVERVHFVFVIGRRPEDLSIDTISAFKGVRSTRVSLLEDASAEAVVRQSEHDSSLIWKNSAIEKVWDWAQGHPYFTQLLCNVVWENVYDNHITNAPTVEAVDIDNSIDKTLQQGANAFHWIWDGLPPAERVVIAAMAEAREDMITQEKLVEILNSSGVRLIVRELELAPETLTEWQLLRPSDGGYRFVVPLLRRWVTTNRPLRRVKEELDRLDPLAENLFRTGQSYYSLGKVIEAESQLRQALQINLNHLKSRLLLGRILLEGGQLAQAVAILEETYKYDDAAARTDLIKALLALADGQTEAEQLAIYERVLNIQRDQPTAKERRQNIWIARGEAAFKEEKWEAALAAFQKAGDLERVKMVRQEQRKRELTVQVQAAARHESDENWDAAVTIYETLLREFPDEGEWQVKLEHAQTQLKLTRLYTEALGALETGKAESAQRLLAEVIAQRPGYKEAARHLLRATTGDDIEQLKQQLVAEKTTHHEAEARIISLRRELEQLEQQLAAERSVRQEAEARILNLRKDLEQLKQQLAVEKITRQDADALIKNLERRLKSAREKEWELERKLKSADEKDWELEKEIARLQGRLEALESTSQEPTLAQQPTFETKSTVPAKSLLLKLWSPFDYFRLLWWVLVKPKALNAYKTGLQNDALKRLERQGSWLASVLIWWPWLAFVTWAYWDTQIQSIIEARPWLLIALGIAWLQTGALGHLRSGSGFFGGFLLIGTVAAIASVITIPKVVTFISISVWLILGATFFITIGVVGCLTSKIMSSRIFNKMASSGMALGMISGVAGGAAGVLISEGLGGGRLGIESGTLAGFLVGGAALFIAVFVAAIITGRYMEAPPGQAETKLEQLWDPDLSNDYY